MATIEITEDNIQHSIENNSIVLIDFWADWCAPCKTFGPIFEASSENHNDILFGKCDTESQQDLAAAFQIRAIPTLAVFREQILIHAQPGLLQASELERLIQVVRDLDMDEVRQTIEEHEKSHQHGPDCNHEH